MRINPQKFWRFRAFPLQLYKYTKLSHGGATASKSPFLQSVRTEIRTKQYSYRTEKTYLYWIRQSILFNDKKHPEVMGNHEIEHLLNHLAVNRRASPATQNQALCAIIFLYKNVLKREIKNLQYKMSKTPRRMPTALNPEEVASILGNMKAEYWLITAHLYGCGLRISEALSLRIKDIDLKSRNLLVFNGKGRKDRYTLLPGNLSENMEWQIAHSRGIHESDLAEGFGAPGERSLIKSDFTSHWSAPANGAIQRALSNMRLVAAICEIKTDYAN